MAKQRIEETILVRREAQVGRERMAPRGGDGDGDGGRRAGAVQGRQKPGKGRTKRTTFLFRPFSPYFWRGRREVSKKITSVLVRIGRTSCDKAPSDSFPSILWRAWFFARVPIDRPTFPSFGECC
jgi:hypothetical protein